jgi:luciferase family oxidoreductase group 1
MLMPLSVLDLSPIAAGSKDSEALTNTLDLARTVDRLGYSRYWLAEHHSIPSVASTAPEIMIGHVASVTERIRVGSGGIMLPNHPPLRVAEEFRVLEALHPGRIDLGIGRAPGSSQATALALRRSKDRVMSDEFPELIGELLHYFRPPDTDESIQAIPRDVSTPPIWMLGSTEDGAQIAAALGVGFAFAHHINPDSAEYATQIYRSMFKSSTRLDRPRVILALSAICAESSAAAEELASSLELAWVRLRSGKPSAFPSPKEAQNYHYNDWERSLARAARAHFTAGTPDEVKARLLALADQCQADELMVMTMAHSHAARVRSYELLAESFQLKGLETVRSER